MHLADRLLVRRPRVSLLAAQPVLARLVPVEQLLLVVAPDDDRPGAPRNVEDAERIRASRDEVADEDEPVSAGEGDGVEERGKLARTAVHITDDDRAHRVSSRACY